MYTTSKQRGSGGLDSFVVLALIVTFLLRYAPFSQYRLLYAPFLDNVHIYGPMFSEVSRLALSGVVPYYLPDIGTGFPIFESPHLSILYPFYFFGLINYGGPLESLYMLTDVTLLHVLVFYINLYVLLRCATVPAWAAYVGASVGMLAANTEIYAGWITIAASYAWLPLVLAGAVLLLRFPGKANGILTFSIAMGLLALASPSQAVIHATFSCLVLFAVGITWLCLHRRVTDVGRVAVSLIVGSALAFGLAGAAILPMYIATRGMIRHVAENAAVIGHAHIPWESFNLTQLRLGQAAGIIIRPTWIYVVGSPYIGPLGAVGTLLAGIYFRRLGGFLRVLGVAFAIIGLYGLLSGFGTNLGLAYLNFYLPFINRIREAGRHLVLFVIGVSFLTGIGYSLLVERFKQYKEQRNGRLLIAPATLAVIFVGTIVFQLVLNGPGRMRTGYWALTLAPCLFLLGHACRLSASGSVALPAVLVSLAAWVAPVRGIPVWWSDFDKPLNLLSHRVLRRLASQIDASGYRVDFRDNAFDSKFWGMNASYYSIKNFYNELTPQPYDQFHFMLLSNIPHAREMMGARYVLCGPQSSPLDPNAKQILETEGYRLYENPSPMGRLTIVHRVASFDSEGDFINIVSSGFDYFSQAYLTPGDFNAARQFLGAAQLPAASGDRITNVLSQPNRSYSTVESDGAALLVLNEWYTPAWKVQVNGKHQQTLRVNQWQTGVLVPAGKNRVEFEYQPTLFRVLTVLSRITIMLLLLFMIVVAARRVPFVRRNINTSPNAHVR